MLQPDTLTLIDHPDNILGKGILSPAREAALLAEGMRFAAIIRPATDKCPEPGLLVGKRDPVEAAIDMFRDWQQVTRQQTPSRTTQASNE